MRDRQQRALLHRAEDDGRARRAHCGDGAEAVAEQTAEVFGIAATHFHQVAVLAGDVVDLQDLGDLGQKLAGVGRADALVDPNEDEGEQTQPEGVRIETGLVAAQDPAGLELAQALEHRRGRHVDLAGDLGVGHASVFLNDLQYLCVYVIDCSAKHDFWRIMPRRRCVKRGLTAHRAGLRGVSVGTPAEVRCGPTIPTMPSIPAVPASAALDGLPLLHPTAPSWAALAAGDLRTFLSDHAVCEQQAALSAMALIGQYPDDPELVDRMSALAAEE